MRILFLVPRDEIGHGTMIAGIAGGNEVPDSNFYGAPDAEFVVVKLKPAKSLLGLFYSRRCSMFSGKRYISWAYSFMKCP